MSVEKRKKSDQFYSSWDLALGLLNIGHYEEEVKPYMNKLIRTNPWKAFVFIHAGLECQMRYALHLNDLEKIREEEADKRWANIWKNLHYFRPLTEICFIVGIIDGKLRDKLVTFNKDRNEILGHIRPHLTEEDIPDEKVERICRRGLKLAKELSERIFTILSSLGDRMNETLE